jgi:threonyl-tRNA synthetase
MSETSTPGHARKEGKRTKLATSHKHAGEEVQLIGGDWKFQKKPAFLVERNAFFDGLLASQVERYAAMPKQPITITLPDGNQKQGTSFETSPLDVAKMISS